MYTLPPLSNFVYVSVSGPGPGPSPLTMALFDPTSDHQTPGGGIVGQFVFDGTASDWVRIYTQDNADGLMQTVPLQGVAANQYVYNGATWDRERTPASFHSGVATASGATTVWTPAAGKTIRLMGYMIEVTGDATLAAGAVTIIDLADSGSGIDGTSHHVFVPTTAPTNPAGLLYSTGWIPMGNGFLLSAPDNVLQVELGDTLTAGECVVTVFGVEET